MGTTEVLKNLIGRKVLFSIGSPWHFVSSDGDNRLYGSITGYEDTKNNEKDIICDVTPLISQGSLIKEIIVSIVSSRGREVLKKTLPELLVIKSWSCPSVKAYQKNAGKKYIFTGGIQLVKPIESYY